MSGEGEVFVEHADWSGKRVVAPHATVSASAGEAVDNVVEECASALLAASALRVARAQASGEAVKAIVMDVSVRWKQVASLGAKETRGNESLHAFDLDITVSDAVHAHANRELLDDTQVREKYVAAAAACRSYNTYLGRPVSPSTYTDCADVSVWQSRRSADGSFKTMQRYGVWGPQTCRDTECYGNDNTTMRIVESYTDGTDRSEHAAKESGVTYGATPVYSVGLHSYVTIRIDQSSFTTRGGLLLGILDGVRAKVAAWMQFDDDDSDPATMSLRTDAAPIDMRISEPLRVMLEDHIASRSRTKNAAACAWPSVRAMHFPTISDILLPANRDLSSFEYELEGLKSATAVSDYKCRCVVEVVQPSDVAAFVAANHCTTLLSFTENFREVDPTPVLLAVDGIDFSEYGMCVKSGCSAEISDTLNLCGKSACCGRIGRIMTLPAQAERWCSGRHASILVRSISIHFRWEFSKKASKKPKAPKPNRNAIKVRISHDEGKKTHRGLSHDEPVSLLSLSSYIYVCVLISVNACIRGLKWKCTCCWLVALPWTMGHHQDGIKFAFDNMKRQMPYAMLNSQERRTFFFTAPRTAQFMSQILSSSHPQLPDVQSIRNAFADVIIDRN